MKKVLISMLAIVALMSSCGVGQQVTGAYNLTKCEYTYNSMKNLTISGMNVSSGLSALNLVKMTALFTGNPSSIPMNMTLNINIKNPNASAAILNGLQYAISIDNIEFTTGRIDQQINVASGATSVLPIAIGVDLATLMKNNSKDAVVNIAKNLVGISSDKSTVSLKLKPTFLIGNTLIVSPIYYPVSFSFGGK